MIHVTSSNVVVENTVPPLLVSGKPGIQLLAQNPALLTEVVVAFLSPGKRRIPP
jgi:hypothetical protein